MSRYLFYLALTVCLTIVSCTPKVPSRYIQPDDMEDLLCDFHVAQSMAEQEGKSEEERNYLRTLYFASVLEKHGVTKADFDSSLTYYYIRADRFSDVYKNVAKRLSEQAIDLGASEGEVNRFANLNANGDTTDVWTGNLSAILLPYIPYNIYSFEQKADTSFHNGDSYMLILATDFVYQSGQRNAEVCLSMRYDNDSIISRTIGLSSTGISQLRMPANADHTVKDIKGYVYLTPEKETSSSLKLMFIKNIQLIKFRKQSKPEQENNLKTKSIL